MCSRARHVGWKLECVLTSLGGGGGVTPLTPRQHLSPTPYALYASQISDLDGGIITPGTVNSNALDSATAAQLALAGTGGTAANAIANLNGLGTNTTLVNPVFTRSSTDTGLPGVMVVTNAIFSGPTNADANGGLALLLDNQDRYSYVWFRGPSNAYGGLKWWPTHGNNNPELLLSSSGTLCMDWGSGRVGRGLQMGVQNVGLNIFIYNQASPLGPQSLPWNTNLGGSVPYLASANYWNGSGVSSARGGSTSGTAMSGWNFMARNTNGNTEMVIWDYFDFDTVGPGGGLNRFNYAASKPRFRFLLGTGGGLDMRGKLVLERTAPAVSGTNIALDFNSSQCIDLSPGGTELTFYTTNTTGQSTNFEQRVFIIRSGGIPVSLRWPAWTWVGSIVTNLTPSQLMRLQLESVGAGENNIIASAAVGNDATFAWQPEATNYFALANITNETAMAAFNAFVTGLKADGIWDLLYELWPMYGAAPTHTSQSLLPNGHALIWHGDLINPALHSIAGVSNTATTGSYADTGFTPTSVAGFNITNFHIMVWNRTTNGYGASSTTWGSAAGLFKNPGYSYTDIYVTPTEIRMYGPFNGGGSPTFTYNYTGLSQGAVGFIILQADTKAYLNSTPLTRSGEVPADGAIPNFPITLFAQGREISGAWNGTESPSNLMLAGASFGRNMRTEQIAQYYSRWLALQTALKRIN